MMSMVEEVAKKRVERLRNENRDISLDCIVRECEKGQSAVIIYSDYNFSPMGFDFIESKESWNRPEAIDEYNSFVNEGYCVVVYVPESVMGRFEERLKDEGARKNIRYFTIERGMNRKPNERLMERNRNTAASPG
ncbi:MAG: hypothetical protein A4E32_00300 [Methanomassiliicoccales archaeon PtaU1.Bin124]|nr:MAG: hypothetical protein A4E32_00300 [Methanomassiliicoccales archaeon PtaU1.Bin124]